MHRRIIYPVETAAAAAVVVLALLVPGAFAKEKPITAPFPKAVTTMSLDQARKVEFPWGWIRWLMDSTIDKKATMTFGVVEIDAGKDNPLHLHPNCDEYLYVVSGTCEHVVGNRTVVLKEGDILRIPQNVPHKAKTLGQKPCRAVIVYNTGQRRVTMLETGGKE